MKKLQLILALITFGFPFTMLFAQAPQAIPYQAVARDNSGNPIADQAISLRFSIHEATLAGTIVYSETHTVNTNSLGLFTVNIGQGIPVTGIFSSINWETNFKFMQVEMDISGGTSYTDMGTQQMLSVPYALSAGNGNWNKNGNDIYNSNENNVGVGTTTPSAKFHTTGKVRLEGLSGRGNRIVLADSLGNLVIAHDSTYALTNSTSVAIPDGSCTGMTSSIVVSNLPVSVSTSKISVKLNITHPLDGDLRVYLTVPNGSVLNLAHTNGGSSADFTNTVFTDNAAGLLTSGTAPFTGSFKPTGNMAVVCSTTPTVATFTAIGGGSINPNGTWTLKVFDQGSNGVTGTLSNWSISFTGPDVSTIGGTNNYIPKWNYGNLTGTSRLFDDDVNIGIGTTTPTALSNYTSLSINNPVNGSVLDLMTNNVYKMRLVNTSNSAVIETNTGVPLSFSPALTEAMRITTTGNIGIGTTSPTAISNFTSLSINNPVNGSVLDLMTNNVYKMRLVNTSSSAAIETNTGVPLSFSPASTEAMRITTGGNVGIGTTSPTALSNYTTLSINNPVNGSVLDLMTNNVFKMRLVNTSNAAVIETNTSVPLSFSPAGTESMRITTNGNVGIGTTAPVTSAILDLSSTEKGFLPPRMTAAERDAIANPVAGLVVYCTDCEELQVFNGTSWKNMNGSAASNYPNVTICNQVWMTKNMDISTYRNGDPIPKVTDPTIWSGLTTGAYCYYNNDSATYAAVYGKLYNWYAVNDPRGLAPEGWHVPSDAEWQTLETCLGGNSVAGGKMKEAGTAHWSTPNTGATNSSGFAGLPGGFIANYGTFYFIGSFGYWWSSTEYNAADAWYRYLNYYFGTIYRDYGSKHGGFSVRCLRD